MKLLCFMQIYSHKHIYVCEGYMHANTYNCVRSTPASPNNLLKEGKRTDVQQTSVGLLNALLEILRDPSDARAI